LSFLGPIRTQLDFFVFIVMSIKLSSFSHCCNKLCSRATEGANNKMSSAYRTTKVPNKSVNKTNTTKEKYTNHTYTSSREDLTDLVNEWKLFIALISEGNEFHHHRALAAAIRQVPPDWKRSIETWLRATEVDLGPLNFGLATALRKATHYSRWLVTYCGHSNAPVEYATKEKSSIIHCVHEEKTKLENI